MACNVALRVQRKEGGYHAVAHDRGAPRNGISHFKEARTKQKGGKMEKTPCKRRGMSRN